MGGYVQPAAGQDDDYPIGVTPLLSSDDDLAEAMLGKMPAQATGTLPGSGNGMPPGLAGISQPSSGSMQPPGPPNGRVPMAPMRQPSAMQPPTLPGANQVRDPNAPPDAPQYDMGRHQSLVDALTKASQPAVAKPSAWDHIRTIIAAAAAGYGRDPGAVGRGLAEGARVGAQPQEEADKKRQDSIDAANAGLKNEEYDYGNRRAQYEDQMKGYTSQTSRMGELEREKKEDAAAKLAGTEVDRAFNGGKPTKIKGPDGKDEWVVRTKSGMYVPTEPPEEKPYKSAYERSQSKDPKEAAQGKADYEREEKRRDVRTANDTTKATASKEKADKYKTGAASGKSDPAVRHYNDKVDKARKAMNDALATVKAVPNYDKKPILKQQAQNAVDTFNETVSQYHSEYQDEAGDKAMLPAPAKISYPWEKPGTQSSGQQKTAQPPAQKPTGAQGSKGNAVDTFKNPKSGKTYTKGQKLDSGPYAGKTIKQVYDNGQVEFEEPSQEQKSLDDETAAAILKEAGGDKDKARGLAKGRGYKF